MAVKEFESRIQFKRDTSANWTANDPIILDGEIIIVKMTDGQTKTKTGDGVKTYTQLPFDDEAVLAAIPTKVSALENDSGYLTSVPPEYITETELTAKQYLTSIPSEYITETELNAKGYLTQHQSLDGKQDRITGTAGDFVVIGSDGNVTTKTIAYAEEVEY